MRYFVFRLLLGVDHFVPHSPVTNSRQASRDYLPNPTTTDVFRNRAPARASCHFHAEHSALGPPSQRSHQHGAMYGHSLMGHPTKYGYCVVCARTYNWYVLELDLPFPGGHSSGLVVCRRRVEDMVMYDRLLPRNLLLPWLLWTLFPLPWRLTRNCNHLV